MFVSVTKLHYSLQKIPFFASHKNEHFFHLSVCFASIHLPRTKECIIALVATHVHYVHKTSRQKQSMCVYKLHELSLVAVRQAPAARRGRESQCDLFLSSLRGYFYQCGWARLVFDREGLPYGTGLQMKCVHTATSDRLGLNKAFTCLCLFASRCCLFVCFSTDGWTRDCWTYYYCLFSSQ